MANEVKWRPEDVIIGTPTVPPIVEPIVRVLADLACRDPFPHGPIVIADVTRTSSAPSDKK